MRAADSDRQFVADRLRDALTEGRLDLGEYDERLQQTYAARTYGELDALLNDLPATIPPDRAQVAKPATVPLPGGAANPGRRPIQPWLIAIWGGWLITTLVCFVIWGITGAHSFPWPLWVAGPWGAVLLARTIGAIASGDPATHTQSQQARDRQRRQERWDRRHDRWERGS
jgi:hypothetical protein